MFGIESSEQQHMPPVSTQPWFPAASLGQRHMNSEQTFDGTLEDYSSEVWIITHLFKPNALFLMFSECISALWVSRSASNAVQTAVLTVR